jgi:hypothetical protein
MASMVVSRGRPMRVTLAALLMCAGVTIPHDYMCRLVGEVVNLKRRFLVQVHPEMLDRTVMVVSVSAGSVSADVFVVLLGEFAGSNAGH